MAKKFKLGQNFRKLWRRRVANNPKPHVETMTPDIKNPFASKTIWGAILVVLGLIGRVAGFDVPKDEISGLVDLISANWDLFMQIIGAALAVWGRFTAKAKLGFGNK